MQNFNNSIKNGINLSDLIGKGTSFEFDGKPDEYSEMIDTYDDDDDDIPIEDTKVANPCNKPFDELKKEMTKISPYLHKKIIEEGGPEVPEFCDVKVHYNAYLDGQTSPFDSTYLRGRPLRFAIGCGDVLPGLQEAVSTMKRGEESHFIIGWQQLYGEIGCEPRIPGRADGLFVIKLIDFKELAQIVGPDELEATEFFVRFTQATVYDAKGKSIFKHGNYEGAVHNYLEAKKLIDQVRLKDEHEEKANKEFLYKLNLNLAVCYNKLNKPKKACIHINNMRQLKSISNNAKALYQEGIALMALNEYGRARKCLLAADKLNPENRDIEHAIKKLDLVEERYKREEKNIWMTGLGIIAAAEESVKEDDSQIPVGSERIKATLDEFIDSEANEIVLPQLLTDLEVAYIRSLEDELSIKLESVPLEHESVYKITKAKRLNNPFQKE